MVLDCSVKKWKPDVVKIVERVSEATKKKLSDIGIQKAI